MDIKDKKIVIEESNNKSKRHKNSNHANNSSTQTIKQAENKKDIEIKEEKKFFIQQIELYNFMCHSHLKINFNNKITCINGVNGSGKSAVMIAIGIILGLRASKMDRGTLKSLIKRNEVHSVIQLIIYNKSYKTSFFGNRIKLIKNLHTGVFKICNEKNQIYSRKQEDLSLILSYNKINLNLINFLTQDHSKRFLNTTNKKDLYKLFIQSTEIEEIQNLYKESYNLINFIENKVEIEREVKKDIIKNIENKKSLIKNLENVKKNEEEIISLENLKKIIKIKHKKLEIQNLQEKLTDLLKEKNKQTQNLKNIENKIEEEKNKQKEKIILNKKYQQEMESFIENQHLKQKEFELNKLEIKNDIEMFEKKLEEKQKELNLLKIEDNKKEIELQINEIEIKRNAIKKEIKNTEEDFYRIKKIIEEMEKQSEEKNREIFTLKKQLHFYEKQETSRVSFFGKNMINVLNEIKETKFKDKIIGPLGLFLDVKDIKYATAISIALQKRLSTFITFNQKDLNTLNQIFKRNNAFYPVIKPKSKDLSIKYKQNNSYKSILNSIDIQNSNKSILNSIDIQESEIIKNNLILFDNIENTYLAENRRDAYKILDNISADTIFTKEGDRIKKINKTITEYRQKNIKIFFKSNQKERLIKKLKQIKNTELKETEEVKKIREKYKNKELNEILKYLNRKIEDNKNIRENIENKKEELTIHFDLIKREQNKEEIEHKKRRINEIKEDMKLNEEQIENIKEEEKEIERELIKIEKDIKNKREDIEKKIKKIEIKGRDYYFEKMKVENEIRNFDIKIEENNAEIEEYNAEIEKYNAQESIKKYNAQESYAQESITQESIKNYMQFNLKTGLEKINEKISFLSKQNEVIKENKLNLKEELLILKNLEEKLNRKSDLIKNNEEIIKKNSEENKKREIKMKKIKNEISKKTEENFKKNTAVRNYKGRLVFNHEDRTLENFMSTKIHENENEDFIGGKDTLSGGERSFAGICLLLSLYEFIDSPLKILDEFDVFMDNLNRNAVFKLLFEFFNKRDDQILLITPLGFNGFDCDVVTVKKK